MWLLSLISLFSFVSLINGENCLQKMLKCSSLRTTAINSYEGLVETEEALENLCRFNISYWLANPGLLNRQLSCVIEIQDNFSFDLNDIAFHSLRQFKEAASALRPYINCVSRAAVTCNRERHSVMHMAMVHKRIFLGQMCTYDSTWWNKYLESSRCINRVKFSHCTSSVPIVTQVNEESLQSRCRDREDIMRCFTTAILMRCGTEAATLFLRLVVLTTDDDFLCSPIESDNAKDSYEVTGTTTPSFLQERTGLVAEQKSRANIKSDSTTPEVSPVEHLVMPVHKYCDATSKTCPSRHTDELCFDSENDAGNSGCGLVESSGDDGDDEEKFPEMTANLSQDFFVTAIPVVESMINPDLNIKAFKHSNGTVHIHWEQPYLAPFESMQCHKTNDFEKMFAKSFTCVVTL